MEHKDLEEGISIEEQIDVLTLELKNKKTIFNLNLETARDYLSQEEKNFLLASLYISVAVFNTYVRYLSNGRFAMGFFLPIQICFVIAIKEKIRLGFSFKKEVERMDEMLEYQSKEIHSMEEEKKILLHQLEVSKQSPTERITEVMLPQEGVCSKRKETIETLYQEKENLLCATKEKQKSLYTPNKMT